MVLLLMGLYGFKENLERLFKISKALFINEINSEVVEMFLKLVLVFSR